jgi:hypothetical protein
MNTPMTEFEAKNLLELEGRRFRARAVLSRRESIRMTSLVSAIATGAAVYFMADFAAPLAVKGLIAVAFVSGVVSQIESWQLQRRLDAAIELLRQAENVRG